MLQIEGLVARQGDFEVSADLSVKTGARVAVIGPSGGGKSTLMGAVCGFVPIARGRVLLEGQDMTRQPPNNRGIATLFQDGNLFPHLTIAQNVGLGLRPVLNLTSAEHQKVATALDRVGLSGMADRRPADLSGGQQSRAALARALIMSRPWLMLDEPFAALGPALRAEMLDVLSDILDQTGAGLLMITHAPEDAQRIAPQTILVVEGKAHPPQDTDGLFADPPKALRNYLG